MTGFRWIAVTSVLAILMGSGYGGSVPFGASARVFAEGPRTRRAVAADRVTIRVQPSIVGGGRYATASGSVANGRADEDVKIQGKDWAQLLPCGRWGDNP